MTRILIAGATGLVGGHALTLALTDRRIDYVVAPTRRALAAHLKLLNPVVDFDKLPTGANWWSVDAAICALGTTRAAGSAEAFHSVDHDLVVKIAARVRKHGATRFALVSAMGADASSRFFYMRTKGDVEEAVKRLRFTSLTIVRPGLLGGNREEVRPMERAAQIALRAAAPLLPARLRISPAQVVARALVDAAIAGGPGETIIEAAEFARSDARSRRN